MLLAKEWRQGNGRESGQGSGTGSRCAGIGRSHVNGAKVAHGSDTVRAKHAKWHAQTIHLLLSLKRHGMITADLSDTGLVRAWFRLCSALAVPRSSAAE
jgi:hypothetical protein